MAARTPAHSSRSSDVSAPTGGLLEAGASRMARNLAVSSSTDTGVPSGWMASTVYTSGPRCTSTWRLSGSLRTSSRPFLGTRVEQNRWWYCDMSSG